MTPNSDTMLEAWVITPRALAQTLHEDCPLKHKDTDTPCPRMQYLMDNSRKFLRRATEFDTARMTATTKDEWEESL